MMKFTSIAKKRSFFRALGLSLGAFFSFAVGSLHAVLPAPLVYFNFEGDKNGLVTDKSGNGHVGGIVNSATLTSVTRPDPAAPLTSTVDSRGIRFSGGYVNITTFLMNTLNGAATPGQGSYSFSCWINPETVNNDEWFIGQTTQGIHCGILDSGGLKPRSGHWSADFSGSTVLSNNTWFHVVHTYDGPSKFGTIYINGVAEIVSNSSAPGATFVPGETKATQNAPNNTTGNLILGARSGGGNAFSGLMDEFVAWNKVLTPAEVASLYGGETPIPPIPAPLAYYDFEGDTTAGATAKDKTANAFDGAVSGAVDLDSATGAIGSSTATEGVSFTGGYLNMSGFDMATQLSSYTISCWIKPATVADDKWFVGQTVNGVHLGIYAGSKLRSGHWGSDYSGSTVLNAGEWIHAAYTFDAGATQGRIYLNGKLDGSSAQFAPGGPASGNLILGARNGGGQAFGGLMDDTAVWNSVLTAKDIARLSNGASPISASTEDADGDGIYDGMERRLSAANGQPADTNNLNGNLVGPGPGANTGDFDGDGCPDLLEVNVIGTDPFDSDSDDDGLLDGVESNTGTWVSASNTGTNPLDNDSDDDGYLDGWENNSGTFVDGTNTGTNPTKLDTDGDYYPDNKEISLGTDPSLASSFPSIQTPLVYFDFEEDTGSAAKDKSGNVNDGAVNNNVAFVDSAAAPNGTGTSDIGQFSAITADGFLNVPTVDMNAQIRDIPLPNTGGYTLACWLKPTTLADGFIFGQTNQGVHNGVRSGGKLNTAHWGSDFLATTVLTAGEWVHAVWTYDGISNTAKIYRNGVQDGSFTQNAPTGGGNLLIGKRQDGSNYVGDLDDVTVWNQAFPAAHVLDIYNGIWPAKSAFELWRLQFHGTYFDNGAGANVANGDADVLNNLQEFAFGTDPLVSDANDLTVSGATFTPGLPIAHVEAVIDAVNYTARFVRRVDFAAENLAYTPEFSADLSGWEGSATVPTVVATQGDYEVVEVPYPFSLPSNGRKPTFFRVAVTYLP